MKDSDVKSATWCFIAARGKPFDAWVDASSPYTLTGLEPGVEYEIHGVITDAEYASAVRVSASSSGSAVAGS